MLMLTEDSLKQANSDKGDSQKACVSKNINILTCLSPLKRRCIILISQNTQVCTRTQVQVYTYHTFFPTQRWLFLRAQTINCHSLELAMSTKIFLKFIPFAKEFKSNNSFFFPVLTPTQPSCLGSYWLSAWRAEEKFKRLFPGGLTSLTLALSSFQANSCPTKSSHDRSQHKVVHGCMRRAHFLMPPLVLLNHLVRGAQTMACMALKGHYNIAFSTFTATKLNGPCLRGRIKRSTALMSCRPQIRLDSAGRFGDLLRDRIKLCVILTTRY